MKLRALLGVAVKDDGLALGAFKVTLEFLHLGLLLLLFLLLLVCEKHKARKTELAKESANVHKESASAVPAMRLARMAL